MNKPHVSLSALHHRGALHIKVLMDNNDVCKNLIKTIQGRKWSQTHRCWYVPYTAESFQQLKALFSVEIIKDLREEKKLPVETPVRVPKPTLSKALRFDNGIKVERESQNRIKVYVPWQAKESIQLLKSINGRAWNEVEKYWSVPLTQQSLVQLKQGLKVAFPASWKLPEYLPEDYRSKKWSSVPSDQTLVKKVHSNTTISSKHPAKRRIPTASLNKLCINPTAIPSIVAYTYNGETLYRVQGASIIIKKTMDDLLEAYVPFDKKGWLKEIKQIPGRVWEIERKCWVLPYTVETISLLYRSFGKYVHFTFRPTDEIIEKWNSNTRAGEETEYIFNAVQRESLIALEEQLMLERKSYSTISSYKSHLRQFLKYYRQEEPEKINEEQIKDYILHLIRNKNLAESTQNQVINAIKAFYEKVLKQDRKMYHIPRPKRRRSLPKVLSEREVVVLLKAVENSKHKAILMVIYSAGLRLGELVNLKIRDMDLDRRRIFIHAGKGKKDRYTLLSDKAILHLQAYMKQYRPTDWLFEGAHGGQYSKRSVQNIFKKACRNAGIKKPVTVHSLRHSFATHLHEKGISLRHIQGLLGHESSKTTEIYTHLTSKGFGQLKSPLDSLDI